MKKSIIITVLFLCSFMRGQQITPIQIIEVIPEVVCPGDTVQVRFIFPQPPSQNQQFKVGLWLSNNNIILFDTIFTGNISQLVCVDTLQSGGFVYGVKKRIPFGLPSGQWYANGNILNPVPYLITVNWCAQPNPCDTIQPALNYSSPCHTFCAKWTYNISDPFCAWVRIHGLNCDSTSYVWYVNGGPPTVTPSIIFTPDSVGVTTFTLSGVKWVNGQPCFQYVTWSFTTVACTYSLNPLAGIYEYDHGSDIPIYFTLYGLPTSPTPNTLLIEQRGTTRRKVIIQSP